MPITEITPLPIPPSRQDPVNFSNRADTFLGALPTFATEVNTVAESLGLFIANGNYTVPVAYAAGVVLNSAAETVEYSGNVYALKFGELPYTLTGNWVTDSIKLRLIQGVAATDLAASDGAAMVGYMPAGTGAVATTVQSKLREAVSVKDFGADSTGSVDAWQAITNAAAYAASSKLPLEITGIFKTSAELDFSAVPVIHANNAVIRPSFDTGSAVKYVASSGNFIENMKLLGNLTVEWPTQDWTKERTSFYFCNVYNGEFHISSKKATRGVVCLGDNKGVVYNNFYLGDFFNNLVGVWLDSVNATGWCNMNRFHGGYFYGTGNPTGSLYASYAGHIYTASSPYAVNGNIFLYPSLEWGDTTGGFRLARLRGTRNKLLIGYCEINAGDTTWMVIGGEKNLVNCQFVPYAIGYEPTLPGASNRIDASTAVEPWIVGTKGYLDSSGEGTQYYKNNSPTFATMTLGNSGGSALKLYAGGFDFTGNTSAEGVFTPSVSGSSSAGTTTYTKRWGSYTKIGKRVFFTIALSWSGHTGTGDLQITNLPFAANSASENYTPITVFNNNVATTAGTITGALILPTQSIIQVYSMPTGGGGSGLVGMDAAGDLYLSGHYYTA